MSEYYPISQTEMEQFMSVRRFVPVQIPGTHEIVYSKPVFGKDLEIRIYSSIDGRGGARTVGDDAIRLIIFSTKDNRGVGSDARVYRVVGWKQNLEKRIRDITEQASYTLVKCVCGSYMIERQGKYGKFLGCVRFPDCRQTRKV